MCITNKWNRIEAIKIPNNPFRFELRGMRSDGVLVSRHINVFQLDKENRQSTLPGILELVIEGINEFEKCRQEVLVD